MMFSHSIANTIAATATTLMPSTQARVAWSNTTSLADEPLAMPPAGCPPHPSPPAGGPPPKVGPPLVEALLPPPDVAALPAENAYLVQPNGNLAARLAAPEAAPEGTHAHAFAAAQGQYQHLPGGDRGVAALSSGYRPAVSELIQSCDPLRRNPRLTVTEASLAQRRPKARRRRRPSRSTPPIST